jgi:hypothetical protein
MCEPETASGSWIDAVDGAPTCRHPPGEPKRTKPSELKSPASANKTACYRCVFWPPPTLRPFAVLRYVKWN